MLLASACAGLSLERDGTERAREGRKGEGRGVAGHWRQLGVLEKTKGKVTAKGRLCGT